MTLPYSFPGVSGATDVFTLAQETTKALVALSTALNIGPHGPSSDRPQTDLTPWQFFFDETLLKPIWWDAFNTVWRDATGAVV